MRLLTSKVETYIELEVKKSKFLTYLVPFDDFSRRLGELRLEHPKASHHVTAFRHRLEDGRIDEGAKDDGEPSGTSGMPMLKVMIGRDLIDLGVICIRYFGGTKLGAGGLSRAYSCAARMAIDAAEFVAWQKIIQKRFSFNFAASVEIEVWISDNQIEVLNRHYHEAGVSFELQGPEEIFESIPKL